MRLLIIILIALFAAVGIAILLQEDPGYMLISVGEWTIETSVVAVILALVVGFFVLYKLIRYMVRLWRLPHQLKGANRLRRSRKSQHLLAQGQKELTEGRWERAETHLLKGANYSEMPALNYIGAARAAQQLNATWRRDQYLQKASQLSQKDTLAVGLAEAELYLESHEPAKAKATLLKLHTLYPRHPRVLKLLMESHRELGEWEMLRALLPELQKRKVLNEKDYHELQLQVYRELLARTASTGTLEDLRGLWKQIPKPLHHEESLLIGYAGYLRQTDADPEAETLLREALNRQWSENLVTVYGQIGRGDVAAQLEVAQRWLEQHPNDPYLLLTLGRLARRARQWDEARNYLERSIKALPTPDAYQELGEVLEELNDKEGAGQCYRTGLRLLSGRPEVKEGVEVLPPPPKAEEAQPSGSPEERQAAS